MKITTIRVLGLLLLACCWLSCSDDDEPSTSLEPKKLLFAVPAGVLNPDDDCWVIVSDAKGNTLDTARLKDNDVYSFTPPETFTGQYVTLTLLRYYRINGDNPDGVKQQRNLSTYVDIPFGTYGYKEVTPSREIPSVKGTARLTVEGISSGLDWIGGGVLLTGSAIGNWEATSYPNLTFQMDLHDKKSSLLLTCRFDKTFYYIGDSISVGQELKKTTADLHLIDSRDMQVPVSDSVYASIYGLPENNKSVIYASGYVNLKQGGSVAEVPYLGDIFTSHLINVSVKNNNIIQSYTTRDASIPVSMKTVKGDINYLINGNVIEANQPAACDVVLYSLDGRNSDGLDHWQVFTAPGKRTVVIPTIPKSLMDKYDVRSFGYLYENESKELWVYANDYASYSGYEDYLSNTVVQKPVGSNEYWSTYKIEHNRK
jgi:hypothetical protein